MGMFAEFPLSQKHINDYNYSTDFIEMLLPILKKF